MPAYRFPVLIVRDSEGRCTASLVEGPAGAAIGDAPGEALGRIREFLEWTLRQPGGLAEPDFHDGELTEVRVEVRPEYESRGRSFPCAETVAVRVPCVLGRRSSGMPVCAAPTLDVRFESADPKTVRDLAAEGVRRALQGLSPRELARKLPAEAAVLDEVVIRVPRFLAVRQTPDRFPALEATAEPLGARRLRSRFSRAWERDAEVADLIGRLRREKANVLLVGEAGCGKTSILADAVRQVQLADKADWAADKAAETDDDDDEVSGSTRPAQRFWLTTGQRLIAGMMYLGQWEQRCEQVVEELSRFDGYLCVENLLDLVGAAGQGPGDGVAAFFAPYLQRGELRMVAEATPAELDACRRLLPGFAELFQILHVRPFTRPKALAVLERVAGAASQSAKVGIEKGVVDAVHRLFARFQPYQAFPGKAAGFVRDLFDRRARGKIAGPVTVAAALGQFVRATGLPELFLRDDLRLQSGEVIEEFRRQVIGQDGACRAAADLVLTFKAGLNDPGRPAGVLLFCGPTGVGKTELARAISRFFFGHGEDAAGRGGGMRDSGRLIRLDMSEYGGPGGAERLLAGAGCGPSEFVKQVRRRPFAVLLLDEIEKADPGVFDVLLNVFDEGRLTDRYGRLTTFRSMIIIMTSNLGAGADGPAGFGAAPAPVYESEAMSFFRPEFFNRIDSVVTFHPLDRAAIRAITEKELAGIAAREGLTKQNLRLTWDAGVVDLLAKRGFDRRYGARPLQRTLEMLVVTPLAKHLVASPGLREAEIRLAIGAEGELTFT